MPEFSLQQEEVGRKRSTTCPAEPQVAINFMTAKRTVDSLLILLNVTIGGVVFKVRMRAIRRAVNHRNCAPWG